MAKLTNIEQKVLEAFANESLTVTREQRAAGLHYVNAWINASSYADQWGLDITRFRQTITKLSGVTEADIINKTWEDK